MGDTDPTKSNSDVLCFMGNNIDFTEDNLSKGACGCDLDQIDKESNDKDETSGQDIVSKVDDHGADNSKIEFNSQNVFCIHYNYIIFFSTLCKMP